MRSQRDGSSGSAMLSIQEMDSGDGLRRWTGARVMRMRKVRYSAQMGGETEMRLMMMMMMFRKVVVIVVRYVMEGSAMSWSSRVEAEN